MKMTIEKGIPIPEHDGRGTYPRKTKWGETFAAMAPGDSFVCYPKEYMAARLAAALRGIRIATRLVKDEKSSISGKRIHRVWRL